MNQENLDYLKKQVMFSGFGEGLEKELENKIDQNEPRFQLNTSHEFGKDKADAVLHFRKSDNSEMYFFNSYEVTVKPYKQEEVGPQTFYMGKANNYTFKEAANMLSGRAVYKELEKLDKVGEGQSARFVPNGEKYNAWVQLDFKNTDERGNYKLQQFSGNYGYNLEEALQKLPIKELGNEKDRQELARSLEKGNRQYVTFTQDGKAENRFIQANPQYKTITVFDANMKRIRLDQKETNGQETGKSEKQSQGQKAEKENTQKKSNGKRRGVKA